MRWYKMLNFYHYEQDEKEEMYAKKVFAITSSKLLIYSILFYICLTAIFNSLGLHYLCRMNQK